jgi:hypothetical protein
MAFKEGMTAVFIAEEQTRGCNEWAWDKRRMLKCRNFFSRLPRGNLAKTFHASLVGHLEI